MGKVSLQFHGESSEILDIVAGWARDWKLDIVLERLFPDYSAVLLANRDVRKVAAELGDVRRVVLGVTALNLSGCPTEEVVTQNPDCMTLTLGKRTEDALRESALAARTDNPESLQIWRTLAKQLRASMRRGAWVVNPHSGARGFVKNHLYTAGAEQLASTGVRMLAFAGWNEFEFIDEER